MFFKIMEHGIADFTLDYHFLKNFRKKIILTLSI